MLTATTKIALPSYGCHFFISPVHIVSSQHVHFPDNKAYHRHFEKSMKQTVIKLVFCIFPYFYIDSYK